MKVVYISGAYRDKRGAYYIMCNIREAERAALWVWAMGGVALCPHKNTAFFDGAHGIPDSRWLEGDLELLARCDALYALPSSEYSEGSQAEIAYAQELGIPVFYNQGELGIWLEGRA